MFSCWPWRAEQNEERVKVSRKGIYLIYGLVRDESDRAAVFSWLDRHQEEISKEKRRVIKAKSVGLCSC